jgi:hypothetical protein
MDNFFDDRASDRVAAAESLKNGVVPLEERAAVEKRMRDTRRDWRIWALQQARMTAGEMVTWVADGAHNRLDDDQQMQWDRKVGDPTRAMDLATRALVRVVMAEERLDEDAETRAARLAAEQEKKVEAEAARLREIAEQPRTEKKALIRRTMAGILRDAEPDLSWTDREFDLDALFAEFEDDGEDPVETVARLTAKLGFIPERMRLPDGREETLDEAKARTMALARDYWERFAAANGNTSGDSDQPAEEAPPPPARAQGPPG